MGTAYKDHGLIGENMVFVELALDRRTEFDDARLGLVQPSARGTPNRRNSAQRERARGRERERERKTYGPIDPVVSITITTSRTPLKRDAAELCASFARMLSAPSPPPADGAAAATGAGAGSGPVAGGAAGAAAVGAEGGIGIDPNTGSGFAAIRSLPLFFFLFRIVERKSSHKPGRRNKGFCTAAEEGRKMASDMARRENGSTTTFLLESYLGRNALILLHSKLHRYAYAA